MGVKATTIRLDEDLKAWLDAIAAQSGESISTLVNAYLRQARDGLGNVPEVRPTPVEALPNEQLDRIEVLLKAVGREASWAAMIPLVALPPEQMHAVITRIRYIKENGDDTDPRDAWSDQKIDPEFARYAARAVADSPDPDRGFFRRLSRAILGR